MKKRLLTLLTLPAILQGNLFQFTTDLGVAYRLDSLEIDRKIPYSFFPVDSNMTWKDLSIAEGVLNVTLDMPYRFYITAVGKYGTVVNGKLNLVEKYLDDLAEISFESHSNNVRGNVYDLRGALGYRFFSCSNRLMIAPLVGYAYYYNHYRSGSGRWSPSEMEFIHKSPFTAQITNEYNGVWAGFESTYLLSPNLRLFGAIHYDWMYYRSSGLDYYDFTIINDVVVSLDREYKDRARTHGPIVQVGLDYRFCCNFYVGTQFEYRYQHAINAHEKYYDCEKVTMGEGGVVEIEEVRKFPVAHIQWQTWMIQLHLGWYY